MKAEILEWCAATHVIMQKVRHNLAARYPVIALALARSNENPTLLAINAAIDRSEPVANAIAGIVGVSPAAVDRLENVASETVTEAWVKCPIELFWAIDVLHPLDGPQTPEEWGLLRKLWINTGLEEHESYRTAVGISRDRQLVLEYLFRGLCAQGYGEATQVLSDRLVALLPGIETDPEYIWPFPCYVSFVEEALTRMVGRKRAEPSNDAECLLMGYPLVELIRQWESWRCIVAAHGKVQIEVVSGSEDLAKTQWIMRIVIPDFDKAIRPY
ncbi:MAG: hypothetical protein FD157_2903 [Rhodocyclaceae bacterium]|nr:MAG: hypothetical protein FD157_2903 [Rhodocyclaceae bacterium]TND03846.1 MAG: hypothetical protein FD118_1264 [Rhodocyclaceae bacterium]